MTKSRSVFLALIVVVMFAIPVIANAQSPPAFEEPQSTHVLQSSSADLFVLENPVGDPVVPLLLSRSKSSQSILYPFVTNPNPCSCSRNFDTGIALASTDFFPEELENSENVAQEVPAFEQSLQQPSPANPELAQAPSPTADPAALETETLFPEQGVQQTDPARNGGEANATENVNTNVDQSCNLLFPFVSNAGIQDTGIALTRSPNSGDNAKPIRFWFYPANGDAPTSQTSKPVKAGETLLYVRSSGNKWSGLKGNAGFTGYMIAQASFQYCHAFAYISPQSATPLTNGMSVGYLALALGKNDALSVKIAPTNPAPPANNNRK